MKRGVRAQARRRRRTLQWGSSVAGMRHLLVANATAVAMRFHRVTIVAGYTAPLRVGTHNAPYVDLRHGAIRRCSKRPNRSTLVHGGARLPRDARRQGYGAVRRERPCGDVTSVHATAQKVQNGGGAVEKDRNLLEAASTEASHIQRELMAMQED